MSVETGFEQKFGQLVDAHLNEKLPSLTNYRVGFQVIDKTEEGDRAVGIAAFVVNDVWLYIPIFFLNGDLRGTDLIYVKQRDIFVPAADNWISTISERGLEILGKPHDADEFDSMVSTPENTDVFVSDAEFGKTARFDDNSLFSFEELQDMAKEYKDSTLPFSLEKAAGRMGPATAKLFADAIVHDNKVANAMYAFYTPAQVQDMIVKFNGMHEKMQKRAQAEEKVTFYTDPMSKEAMELGDTEKGLLLRNDVYIRDTRTNFSKLYEEQVSTGVVQNPAQPGIYDVLMQNGEYKTFIVLTPKELDSCNIMFRTSKSNVGHRVCLIDIDSPSKYICRKNHEVFAKPSTGITEKQVKALQGGKKASLRTLRDLKDGTKLLFVTSPEHCIETRLMHKGKGSDGGLIVTLTNTAGYSTGEMSLNSDVGQLHVEFTGNEGRLKVVGDHLFVPSHCRVFVQESWRKEDRLALGTPETVYQAMHKQAGLKKIQVFATDNTMEIKTASGSTGLVSKTEGLRHLVEDHGIYGGQAIQLWNRAKRKGSESFLIKHAGPYDSEAYGMAKRPFMGGPTGSTEDAEDEQVALLQGKAHSGPVDADGQSILPEQAVDKAVKASEAGIKEVFDVAVLEGLIDKTDISELRKDYIKDMVQGMDKVGRMMFLFYWHRDEFEERYGNEDLVKLEDTLKNVFTSIGDLVLFLKNKTAYSPESAESLFGSLSEDVATA